MNLPEPSEIGGNGISRPLAARKKATGISPTARTLKALRAAGYAAEVVERWNPHARVRHDLFGFVDVLALRRDETLAVQATSRDNVSARVAKIGESDMVARVREAGWRIQVWGWARMRSGKWECRIVDLS